jgi:hypothetical protein
VKEAEMVVAAMVAEMAAGAKAGVTDRSRGRLPGM